MRIKVYYRMFAFCLLIGLSQFTVNSANDEKVENLKKYIPTLTPLPTSVEGCVYPSLDLTGMWKFNPAPAKDFFKFDPVGWSDVMVPSEWAMQGFSVSKKTSAGYSRTFSLPNDWQGKQVKLRCEAIYSDATIYVNGKKAGAHQGGFTPFEIDVTEHIKFNSLNRVSIEVKNETVADSLASGSKYACHQLGGINRKLKLFVLPSINISSLYAKTTFDKEYKNALLNLNLDVVKDPKSNAKVSILVELTAPNGYMVMIPQSTFEMKSSANTFTIPVQSPLKWDNEHPNLYVLTLHLLVDGNKVQTLKQKLGFKTVEIKENVLYVNGLPVKLRGSNHHEVYPVTGRSVPNGISLLDVKLFRDANVNLLRTCHYPPNEALIHAADSLGMFIECEAPFCWAPGNGYEELVCRQTAEMALAYRNNPSVLFWSLANESVWGRHFESSSILLRYLDPTRPQTFNYWFTNIHTEEAEFAEIANIHYPVHDGPKQAKTYTQRPVYLGEDCHLNAYNRLELATDPGLRDIWGKYIREMWDDIDSTKGCLGQSVWSGIDDTFYMPDGDINGYGTWGPIDGWRRPKPEYWGMKKAYSPVKLDTYPEVAVINKTIEVSLRNRQNFANLSEMTIQWSLGKQYGVVSANVAPANEGDLQIKLKHLPKQGEKLGLKFIDPRGFVADEYHLNIKGFNYNTQQKMTKQSCSYFDSADTIRVVSGKMSWLLSKKQGKLIKINDVPVDGPQLMVLALNSAGETQMTGVEKVWTPFTDPCSKWQCKSTSINQRSDSVIVTVNGEYDEAKGTFIFNFANGSMSVLYQFTMNKSINPRQIGLVFSIPSKFEKFTWERKGYWDVYPDDHIARLKGSVSASEGFAATSVGPRTLPDHPWRLDNLPYGNNDFCSTKNNVITATITDQQGQGLVVDGKGMQHVRCWKKSDFVHVLIADFSNGGSERFLRGLAKADDKPLKLGDNISGQIYIGISSQK